MAKHLTRRDFIKISALAGAGLFVPWKLLHDARPVSAFSNSANLEKFIQPLRMVGSDIAIAVPDTDNPGWWQKGATHYTIDIGQFEDRLHPSLLHPTRLWGFGQVYNPFKTTWTQHLGGVIAAKRGEAVQITFRNHLPPNHIMPMDPTIMGSDLAINRADVHLHGGFVPWTSDGGPFAYWDPNPNGVHGESFLNNKILRPGQLVAQNEAEYYYPNNQSARLMWYHDHTFGNTRINAYAGVASAYVIYDDYETVTLAAPPVNLPGPLDPHTIYLVFQDKVFVTENLFLAKNDPANVDPNWGDAVKNSRSGDLWYNHIYDPVDRDPTYSGGQPLPEPSEVPEFFGDTMLVNGSVYPYLEVEARPYRFRLLNACNARFLNPRLVHASSNTIGSAGSTEVDYTALNSYTGPAAVPFTQIGSEGGFLPAPVELDGSPAQRLLLAPAERSDLIVDFTEMAGSVLILYNDAPAPFDPLGMGGDPGADYYPGSGNAASGGSTFGPNTRTLLQIRVKAATGSVPTITLPDQFTPTDPFLIEQTPGVPTPIPANVPVRRLTLNEVYDDLGRLIQYLGTNQATNPGSASPLFGRTYESDPTEVINAGATEVWEIANLTGDTHPIHFHLVNVHVLARLPFDPATYTGGVPVVGNPIAPDANELGWKETVRMNPGEVTRVLMRFTLPVVPYTVPVSPRTGGHEYVWHCHILEHEEHDMMRPLVVKDNINYMPLIKG
jgi:spore coat protein A